MNSPSMETSRVEGWGLGVDAALTRLFLRRFCAEHATALAARPDLDLPALMQVGACSLSVYVLQ